MALRDDIWRACEAAYPEEACGVILVGPVGPRLLMLKNAYEKYKAVDPEAYPRTNRTAYLFDPLEFQKALETAEAGGEQLAAIVHSHCDVGAYFSTEDATAAAPFGAPLFPNVGYLVVAVDHGRASGQKWFGWSNGAFREKAIEIQGLN